MKKTHPYALTVEWTGNLGEGTSDYQAYNRSYQILMDNKTTIEGSSDLAFRGDASKHNPEELLLASLSSCHLLWYLHLCSEVGVVVTAYSDAATGVMVETVDGGGHFTEATLHPIVTVSDASMVEEANKLHEKANKLCFIANSINFSVKHIPTCIVV